MILGGVFMLWLIITLTTKGKNKARKSKKFMGDYKRDDEQ